MRKPLRTSVLVLALCAPAFAGDIPMVPAPQPPPPNMTAEVQVIGSDVQNEELDSFTRTMLGMIQSVLALF